MAPTVEELIFYELEVETTTKVTKVLRRAVQYLDASMCIYDNDYLVRAIAERVKQEQWTECFNLNDEDMSNIEEKVDKTISNKQIILAKRTDVPRPWKNPDYK